MRTPVPRLAAIHDLSCFGRAALMVVIPILSTMGIQVCPLPTEVFSTHGAFPGYKRIDLTEPMQGVIDHWRTLAIRFDAIYTGFLGSVRQMEVVTQFIQDFSPDIQETELKDWLLRLADHGPEIVIITSVPVPQAENQIAVMAYNRADRRFWKVTGEYIPANFPGTGDAFTSVVTGSLLQGDSLPMALDRAVQFLSLAIRTTYSHPSPVREGIFLERVLQHLTAPVVSSSYELFES